MFTGNEDQAITLAQGAALTASFRAWLAASGSTDATIGEFFSKKLLMDLLNQEDAVGVRAYYGLDANGKRTLVMVGVTEEENDLYEGLIGDRSYKSPPHSGTNNPLNT